MCKKTQNSTCFFFSWKISFIFVKRKRNGFPFLIFVRDVVMNTRSHLPVVLLLSASDPDGSWGIQSEIAVLSSMERRVYVSAIVTSHVVHQPDGRLLLQAVRADVLKRQLQVAIDAFHPDVVRIGIVADAASACIIASVLRQKRMRKVIYNPVFEPMESRKFLSPEVIAAICCHLMPVVRLLVVTRRHSKILLKAKRGAGFAVDAMSDVQLSRCLVSTFHCFCYLSVPVRSDIFAAGKELYYYRPVVHVTKKSVEGKESMVFQEKAGKEMYMIGKFSSAVAGSWTGGNEVKIAIYEAKSMIQKIENRSSYLNENHAAAPYYPLTEGGNYE